MLDGKTLNDQVQEIEKLVADALQKLDQVGYALRALQNRLKEEDQRSSTESAG